MKRPVLTAIFLLAALPAAAETLLLDVKAAESGRDEQNGQAFVSVTLTPDATSSFGQFTTKYLKQQIDVSVDGRILTSPYIQDPLLSGTMQLSGALSDSQAQDLARRLNSGAKISVSSR